MTLLSRPPEPSDPGLGPLHAAVSLVVEGPCPSLRQTVETFQQRHPDRVRVVFTRPHLRPALYLNHHRIQAHQLEERARLWLAPVSPDWTALFSVSRRGFLGASVGVGLALMLLEGLSSSPAEAADSPLEQSQQSKIRVRVNAKDHELTVDNRTTVLSMLRNQLGLHGTKLGCNHGQCGACTVLLEGQRVNSCLLLAVQANGRTLTTIEGLSQAGLHPMQEAFIRHDGFQCGYCTPGQICSAVGLMNEGKARTRDQIREAMSGNICRCGAHQGIIDAISEVVS